MYKNELSDKELIVIYKDIDLYSEEIKEIIKNSSVERGIIKILDEEKIDKEKRKNSIKSRMKYFMIELVVFYIMMFNFVGVKNFFKEIPIIDNIKIIIIMLIIADIIYIVKKKIKWKQAIREYLILKFMSL